MMTAGFGIERIGLLALRFPRTTLAIIAALLPLCFYGASQLTFSSDVREIFRSGGTEFDRLDTLNSQYPRAGEDVLIAVEGDNLLEPSNLEALQALHLELSLNEDVAHVLSMFSVRAPPEGAEASPQPIFPPDVSELDEDEVADLRGRVMAHPLVSGRLLSEDGTLALVALSLREQAYDEEQAREIVDEIRNTTAEVLEGTGLTATLTGETVMQVEIVATLIKDQQTFIGAGIVIGLVVFWLMFRRLLYVLIAGTTTLVGISLLLGTMWLIGQEVNVLTNVVPVVVMVLVFSDALHVLFSIRRSRAAGRPLEESIARAVRNVGPACVLTSLTTMLALLSLMLVDHPFIARFGLTAAIGTGLAVFATLTVIPALSALTMRGVKGKSLKVGATVVERLIARLCGVAADLVARRAPIIAIAGVLVTVGAGLLYAMNEPSYRYSEHLPRDNPAFSAINTINQKLVGSNVIHIAIEWPEDYTLASDETLNAVADAHALLEKEPTFQGVFSLRNVREWLAQEAQPPGPESLALLQKLDPPLAARLFSPPNRSVLLTGYFGDLDASELVPVQDALKEQLGELEEKYPEASFMVTGLVPLSAWASYEMIEELNVSLMTAIAVIITSIAVAMWSAVAGLVSIVPNLLPIAMGGAYLYLTGSGLQFTSVVAFTIGFGIAVDSTIHVLNRYRLERAQKRGVQAALKETVTKIGPVVVVSTLVLSAGMASTWFSEMPMLRLFGTIAVIVITTSLVGAILLLPAIISLVKRMWPRLRIV
jgi:uncharacterized protein